MNSASANISKISGPSTQKFPWGAPIQVSQPSALVAPISQAKPGAARSWNPITVPKPTPIPKELTKYQQKNQNLKVL